MTKKLKKYPTHRKFKDILFTKMLSYTLAILKFMKIYKNWNKIQP